MNHQYKFDMIIISLLFILLMTLFLSSGCGKSDEQSEPNIAYWTCTMHPSVHADGPGQCPICNMDLVPVYEEDHGLTKEDEPLQPGGEIDYWTCGMHPSVRSDEPGKCPICNMDLIPVYSQTDETGRGEEMDMITLKASSRARQLAGVETAEVEYRHLTKQIRTVGKIEFDERRVSRVAAWISGRIDELFIDYTGQAIRAGDPLARIYSPELISTQQEYILTLNALDKAKNENSQASITMNESLASSTRQRLLLWGIPEREIIELEKDRKVREQFTITAPIGGTVVEKTALEGQYVKEGQHLYTVADLSHLWVLADIYEYEMSWIHVGQPVAMTSASFSGLTFQGEVTFIDPVLHAMTRSIKVRTELNNPDGRLKPGMFLDVIFESHLDQNHFPEMARIIDPQGAVLSIPASAVLQTGERTIAYQEVEEGEYIGRNVEIGPRAGGYYPLLTGLSAGDRVVISGNFLIDSQTQLTGLESAAYDASLGEGSASTPIHQH